MRKKKAQQQQQQQQQQQDPTRLKILFRLKSPHKNENIIGNGRISNLNVVCLRKSIGCPWEFCNLNAGWSGELKK